MKKQKKQDVKRTTGKSRGKKPHLGKKPGVGGTPVAPPLDADEAPAMLETYFSLAQRHRGVPKRMSAS